MTVFDELVRDGIAASESHSLSAEKINALFANLWNVPCTPGNHTHQNGNDLFKLGEVWEKDGWSMAGLKREEVLAAPNYLTWALSGYDLAKEYFNEEPMIYSVSAFVTRPSQQFYRDTHDWHRDRDQSKMMVSFMYGTNIDQVEDGAHQYETGSHLDQDRGENYNGYKPSRPVKTVIGPAGTTFFTDPHGCHMAPRPKHRPRMLIWARWAPARVVDGGEISVPLALVVHEWPSEKHLQRALGAIIV